MDVPAGSRTRSLFRPGENCTAVAHTRRIAFLVDGEEYFSAFRKAAERAERSIVILGWDFDSRATLCPKAAGGDDLTLGDFLNQLAEAKPDLRIYILDWDYPMVYGHDREFPPIYGLAWKPHKHICFRYDDTHPLTGSHHQKVVVIDDKMAFAGGLDLAARRWDTSRHAADEPGRVFQGEPYPPNHDVMVAVDGEAAEALATIARDRWKKATQHELPRVTTRGDPWPPGLKVELEGAEVGIARTAPPVGETPGIREVEQLYLDMIAAARDYIYLENQYFTSQKVGEALRKSLEQPEGPEIVVLTRLLSHGWLEEVTMHVLRTRLVRELRDADKHGRFHAFCPHIEGLTEGTCIDLHSKVMIVDDEWLRIGSSNISNRSMGVDTECDVVLEARGEQRVKAKIREFRNRLLAEHLGAEQAEVDALTAKHGRMAPAIEALTKGDRTLCPLEAPELSEAAIAAAAIGDPEKPISLDNFVAEFAPETEEERAPMGPKLVIAAIIVAVLLALVWRYTPLADVVTPERAIGWAQEFSKYWWAPLAVILAYLPASLVMFPRWLITLMAVAAFGPWAAFAYAQTGVLTAALIGYIVGEYVNRDTVRHMAGRRVNRLSEILRHQHRGLLAVTLVRLVPVAPFVVVNVVMGAMRIRLHHFIIGTVLGMLPGMLATTVLGDQITLALADPSRINYWLVALAGLALAGAAAFGHWWLGREPRKTARKA